MKKILLSALLLVGIVTSYGQGRVNFNNPGFLISTNGGTPATTGNLVNTAGRYYFGLYLGSVGTPANGLTLNILATNVASLGRINGGAPAFVAAPFVNDAGPLAFQVRGWSAFGGHLSYEAAIAAADGGLLGMYAGASALGSVAPTVAPNPVVPNLFGTSAGQVGSFDLIPQGVPEPSSIALGLLGLGAVALFRRRK